MAIVTSDVEHRLNVARSKAGYLSAITRLGPRGSHWQEKVTWAARDLSEYLNAWGQEYTAEMFARQDLRYSGETGCL